MSGSNSFLKGKLKRIFDKGDLEGVIEYCREQDIPVRPVLQAFRTTFDVSVEETNRVRTRLFRRRDYKEGRLQGYVKKRHSVNDYSTKYNEKNPNGTRKWTRKEYMTFLDLQEKGLTEVELAKKLKTNLRMIKYLRLKRRLVIRYLNQKKQKVILEKIAPLMDHGDRTLVSMIQDHGNKESGK